MEIEKLNEQSNRKIDLSFSNVELIEKDGLFFILKKAIETDLETTSLQISFLKQLPYKVKAYFPEIIEYNIKDDEVWYTMPYYKLTSLDAALSDNSIPVVKMEQLLLNMLTMLINDFYSKKIEGELTQSYLDKVYFERIKKRINYFSSSSIENERLVTANEVFINGKSFKNPLYIIEKMQSETQKLRDLTPLFTTMTHGDLEANHILFDVEDLNNYKLLDPRVNVKGGDPAYDLGKLFQSLNSYSHLMFSGLFKLEIETLLSGHSHYCFNYIHKRPEEQLIYLKQQLYKEIDMQVIPSLTNWKQRSLFAEASHFLSAPPFFLSPKYPKHLAKMLYIQGVILLNNFYYGK
ncbi:hypothetical protein UY286_04920 [Paenibacillus polymyxa]|uniref:hypothetical protein n=1 Tax=Paenibacillus polymyxa TaxID=1406 RepID=UPI002AB4B33B|nr:hypothetical protein [Paenibacillus polymyxa]MDY7989861.1 hypothetical protein [Paenibacillus polymyxa]MDY8116780.1 hypothetical protein [Paenibacillus polymyxa]